MGNLVAGAIGLAVGVAIYCFRRTRDPRAEPA
jgi:hypothetical protein